MKKKGIIGVCLVLLLILTGCEQRLELKFLSNEKWKIKAEVDFNAGVVKDLGSVAGSLFGDALNTNIPSGLFNVEIYLRPMMTLMTKTLRRYGVEFDWSYNKEKLKYDMDSNSYQLLKEAQLITDLGNGTYRLVIENKGLSSEFGSEFDSILNLANEYLFDNVVEVSVGEIYESNADKVVGSKATWYNPQQIYIVFRPGSSTGILNVLLWVIGIVLALVLLFTIVKGLRRKTCYSCGSKVKLSAAECPNCGSYFGD